MNKRNYLNSLKSNYSVCGYETTTPIAPYTTKPIQDCCDSDKDFGFYHNWRDWK